MPIVVGPIAARRDEIVARVAELLHVADTDEWIGHAVDAAIEYTVSYTNRDLIGLPDDALTVDGVVLFAQRIYVDSPTGAHVAIGDPGFDPIFQPEHLYKHVRHYFDRLDELWGVA